MKYQSSYMHMYFIVSLDPRHLTGDTPPWDETARGPAFGEEERAHGDSASIAVGVSNAIPH